MRWSQGKTNGKSSYLPIPYLFILIMSTFSILDSAKSASNDGGVSAVNSTILTPE